MRIVVTADLHFGISTLYDEMTMKFLRRLEKHLPIDLMIICGDVAENVNLGPSRIGDNHKRLFSKVREIPVGNIAFCAGNHDIWTGGVPDSWQIYSEVLRRVAADCHVSFLDFENLYLDEVAVVGSMGHYDYSFATEGLEIGNEIVNEGHYERKTLPGCDKPVWNDAIYVNWAYSDKEACEKICDSFEQKFKEALHRSDNIIVATHTAPIIEMNAYQNKSEPRSNFLNAFSGTSRLGEIMMNSRRSGKKIRAFSGHTHLAVGSIFKEGVEFINLGGDYGEPPLFIVSHN